MGLFDGATASSEEGSTMELARWTGWPVVLCVPAAKAGRSLAAALRGFIAEAHPEILAGVILNGVSGDSHTTYLREALAPLGIPVLGAIPQHELLRWEERSLGLRAAPEGRLPSAADLRALAEATLDVARLQALARPLQVGFACVTPSAAESAPGGAPSPGCVPSTRPRRIALAEDAAFHFYYAANRDWLRAQHAELVSFSPLEASSIPENPDALVLGGGFPELYAEALAANTPLLKSLREAIEAGVPCYAECGGLMLLAEAIRSARGERFPMAAVVPGVMEMRPALQHFGYCTARDARSAPARGHEFHHAAWRGESDAANAWPVTRRRTGTTRNEGFRVHRLHASFVHLHFPANADLMRNLLHLNP
jgi:cobyrinic acid a,c-diamide synthase